MFLACTFFFYHSWFLPHSSMFQIPLIKGSSLDTISPINNHLQQAKVTKLLIFSAFWMSKTRTSSATVSPFLTFRGPHDTVWQGPHVTVLLSQQEEGKITEKVKMNQVRSVTSDSLRPHGLYSPWNSPGQNTGVGSLSLFQGIFPTQGSNWFFFLSRRKAK